MTCTQKEGTCGLLSSYYICMVCKYSTWQAAASLCPFWHGENATIWKVTAWITWALGHFFKRCSFPAPNPGLTGVKDGIQGRQQRWKRKRWKRPKRNRKIWSSRRPARGENIWTKMVSGHFRNVQNRLFLKWESESLSFSVTTVATDKPFNMVSVFFHSLKTFPFQKAPLARQNCFRGVGLMFHLSVIPRWVNICNIFFTMLMTEQSWWSNAGWNVPKCGWNPLTALVWDGFLSFQNG